MKFEGRSTCGGTQEPRIQSLRVGTTEIPASDVQLSHCPTWTVGQDLGNGQYHAHWDRFRAALDNVQKKMYPKLAKRLREADVAPFEEL